MTAQDVLSSPQLAKLTVKDFLVLAESGAFDRYARTELIEGEIWAVNAIHTRHARAHGKLAGEIAAALKDRSPELEMLIAPSTELSEQSLPEPDIAIVTPNDEKILQGQAVALAIEIADTTLDTDMGRKARLYARHGIPEYWVVNLDARVVHQMWLPTGESYSQTRDWSFGTPIASATLEGLAVETASL